MAAAMSTTEERGARERPGEATLVMAQVINLAKVRRVGVSRGYTGLDSEPQGSGLERPAGVLSYQQFQILRQY